MVEQSAVNRSVVGSSPTFGAIFCPFSRLLPWTFIPVAKIFWKYLLRLLAENAENKPILSRVGPTSAKYSETKVSEQCSQFSVCWAEACSFACLSLSSRFMQEQ